MHTRTNACAYAYALLLACVQQMQNNTVARDLHNIAHAISNMSLTCKNNGKPYKQYFQRLVAPIPKIQSIDIFRLQKRQHNRQHVVTTMFYVKPCGIQHVRNILSNTSCHIMLHHLFIKRMEPQKHNVQKLLSFL